MDAGIIAQTIGSLGSNSNLSVNGEDKADRIAKEFEQMVLSQLLSMTETETDVSDTMFGGGAGERAFKPFLMEEYSKGFAQTGGIGIADAVKAEIIKIQEAARNGGI